MQKKKLWGSKDTEKKLPCSKSYMKIILISFKTRMYNLKQINLET